MSKPFSKHFQKLKNLKLGYFEEVLGVEPKWIEATLPVYIDPRGNTSMVIEIPQYVTRLCGATIDANLGQPVTVEVDEVTGTHFIRTDCNIEVLTRCYRAVMDHYRQKVMFAAKRKVITYAIACSAFDSAGKHVLSGQPNFSVLEGKVIGFTYKVRYLIDGRLYRIVNPNKLGYPPDVEDDGGVRTALVLADQVGRGFDGQNVIDWSPEAEETCRNFEKSISDIGQRLFDYFQQPKDLLKLALENRASPLLAAQG